jgi:hypothetical protein
MLCTISTDEECNEEQEFLVPSNPAELRSNMHFSFFWYKNAFDDDSPAIFRL